MSTEVVMPRMGETVDEAVLDETDAEAKTAVDQATEEAKAGAGPRLELAFTDVWSDGGWEWRN